MRSLDPDELPQRFLARIDSGTDGLFTCPSLRQPGNLAGKDDWGSVPRGPWLCVTASRRFCPFGGWKALWSRRDSKARPRRPPPKLASSFAVQL